jgi:hypothetical protein
MQPSHTYQYPKVTPLAAPAPKPATTDADTATSARPSAA